MFPNIVSLLLLFVIFDEGISTLKKNENIFCIYDSRSFNNHYEGKFRLEHIKSEYCTHLIYKPIGIDRYGTVQSTNPKFDFGENGQKGNIRQFNEQKKNNENLKTLIWIGGLSSVPEYYSNIFRNEENRQRFGNSSLKFATKYNFDGVIVDWFWPGSSGQFSIAKISLILVLKNLKPELEKRNMLLVVFCHGFAEILRKSYNIKEIAKNVDFIYVQSFNYYHSESSHIGIASGLYSHSREYNTKLSADASISAWIDFGAPPEKILMGIYLAGNTFTLTTENKTTPGSPFIGPGSPPKYAFGANIDYMELCQKLSNESWTIKWEDTQKNPYAFKGNQWVGYENERSLEFKAKYVIKKNLGGVVITDITSDDFRGLCGEKYALHRVLNSYLRPIGIDDSRFEYILNIYVLKKNLNDLSTQYVYHTSKLLPVDGR